jgi:hypothetical protein
LYRQFSGSLMPASAALAQPAGATRGWHSYRRFCTGAGVAKAFGAGHGSEGAQEALVTYLAPP